MTNAQNTWSALAAASLLATLAGCSVLIESDKKQCTKDSMCDAPYVCGSQGLCTVETGCMVNEDCSRGGVCIEGSCRQPQCTSTKDDCDPGELCNTLLGKCVRANQADCTNADQCKPFEGAQVCIKSEGLCGDAECETNADCLENSPTASCKSGACNDPTWECLGVVDPREAATSSKTATLKVKVLYAFAQGGAMETGVANLSWRVCNFGDTNCDNLAATDVTYGDDNYLVVKGLEAGKNFKIQLQGTHPTKPDVQLYPTEYLMYRTVVDETVDPKPILMYEESTFDVTSAAAEVKRDPELGMLLMRIFDCTDTEVAGVQISIDKIVAGCGLDACKTTVFYQNTGNIPVPSASETNSAGRGGILNLQPNVFNRITLTRTADSKRITSFQITPRAGWLTYVFFWPWDYSTAVD